MGASFATHVLFLLWFSTATFSLTFFKAESNGVSCNEEEKQALLSLKRGLIDPGNRLSSWSNQQDCCRWDGVRCDNNTGRVIELHLNCSSNADKSLDPKKRLGGVISPSMLQLKSLNYLDLSRNDFNCARIPSFLGSMGNLTYLGLNANRFCGLIPHQLGNLSGLRYLDLSYNHLYAYNLHWMSSLSSIQYLNLSYADLHTEVDWLQIMSKFSYLSELYLYHCQLDSLNPSLGFVNFTSIRILHLSYNLFDHEIPNWLSNLTSLIQLGLTYNSLKGEIPPSIFNFQNLEYLTLGFNKLIGKIPESLGKLKRLTHLDLGGNSFSGPIPSSIGNLSYIQQLSLHKNHINGIVPKSLGLLSNLKKLSIGNNLLTGTIDEAHFTKLSKLIYLEISQTTLFFSVNSNWVPPFQLQYAEMSSCKIGPNFPTWLQTQRSLKVLQMSESGISSNPPGWFWSWISKIRIIDLSGNHIEGDISGIMLNSSVINLSSNHFKGQMPQLAANVKELNIANNSISGPISTFVCKKMNRKNKLFVLEASQNLLSGELPHCWKNLQSLTYLNLGSNSLSGRIPYTMGSLVALQSLHLQNNSISGDIPSSLQNLSQLKLIDVGENHFQVTIPLWIGQMTSLRVLRLRSNGFKGHIPLQICQLSSLIVLDLANNSLLGPIPKCLNNISALKIPDTRDFVYFGNETLRYELYVENLVLVPKGNELKYEETLRYVRIIDLS